MNEITKTLVFAGVAVVAVALAFGTQSQPVKTSVEDDLQQALFPDFTDASIANSLAIVRFDEALASMSKLEAAKNPETGLWTLPTHDGYPVDAENRIRDAATPYIDLRATAVQSDAAADHALYGVMEPNVDKTAVGDQGVGTLVTITDGDGKKLVNLIIGKTVKGNEELRFVRRPGQDRVYVAKVDPSSLPVRFEDWIEKDLLNVNAWDINQLVLKDYTFQVAQSFRGPVPDWDQRLELTVTDDNGTWQLDNMLLANESGLEPAELSDSEQLSQDKLRELKEALDDLEIVDVERKPAQLGDDLKADAGFANDQAGLDSLVERGYYLVTMPNDEMEVLSAEGEVLVRTKDGVEYMLRFGGVEGIDTESEETMLNRYLLVTARVFEDAFPMPEKEELPAATSSEETPESTDETEEPVSQRLPLDAHQTRLVAAQADESTGDDTEAADSNNANDADSGADDSSSSTDDDAANPSDDGETTTSDDASNDASDASAEDEDANDVSSTEEGEEAVESEDGAESAEIEDETAVDSATDDSTATDESASDESASDESASDESDETAESPEDEAARLEAERERIETEYQRAVDERNDKLEEARKKVQELNDRFADWYYVISEEIYKKIHLSHTDLIEPKDSTDDAEDTTSSGGPPITFPGQ